MDPVIFPVTTKIDVGKMKEGHIFTIEPIVVEVSKSC